MMNKSFGDRLKEARGIRARAEMAKVFGVSVTAYGNWERGDKEPDVVTICSICKEYGVSADWLLGLSDAASAPAVPAAPEPQADAYWRGLVASQQATIAKLTALLAEGRATTAAPARAGGRSATKSA